MLWFKAIVGFVVVVALIPADENDQRLLYKSAADAANWAGTFCDRNAEACVRAEDGWTTFVKKAEFVKNLAYDMSDKFSTASDDPSWTTSRSSNENQGTLTAADLLPSWRGDLSL